MPSQTATVVKTYTATQTYNVTNSQTITYISTATATCTEIQQVTETALSKCLAMVCPVDTIVNFYFMNLIRSRFASANLHTG